MASCSNSLFASSAPMKIVPYVPLAHKPKPKPKAKAKPMGANKTAEHSYSGVSSSNDDEELVHIDDLPMPDTNALRPLDPTVPAPFEAPGASRLLDHYVVGGLGTASESEKPEQYPSDQDPFDRETDHATGVEQMDLALNNLFDGSSLESPLILGSGESEEHQNTIQTRPASGALSCQGNSYHATAGTEGSHPEQDSNVDFVSISVPLAEDGNGIHYDEPLPAEHGLSPVEKEPPIDVDMMNKSLLTRKRTRRSPSDTIISLREVLDMTSESELEDTHLAKRQRLSKEQEESIVPHHVPTPKPTFLPTPSSPDSSSGSSNDGQDGSTRSPVPSSNNPDEEGDDDDDGVYAQGLVGKMSRKGIDDQAEEIHEDYLGRVRMSGKSRARCFERSRRINRLEGDLRPITRSQSTIPTRKSRNVTSSQLRQLSKPRSGSTSRSFSPRTASPRKKARGRIDNDECSDYQVTDLARVHVPEGSSILTAIVRSKSNLSLNPMVLDHELLGGEGQVIRMTQLSPDSWMLLGYRYDRRSSTSTRETTTPDNAEWVSSPRSDAASDDTDHSNDEDEECGKDRRNAAKSDIRCRRRTREPWLESDEERLLSYKDKMGMEWKDICKRFPDRSPGAVKVRYHMLRKKDS